MRLLAALLLTAVALAAASSSPSPELTNDELALRQAHEDLAVVLVELGMLTSTNPPRTLAERFWDSQVGSTLSDIGEDPTGWLQSKTQQAVDAVSDIAQRLSPAEIERRFAKLMEAVRRVIREHVKEALKALANGMKEVIESVRIPEFRAMFKRRPEAEEEQEDTRKWGLRVRELRFNDWASALPSLHLEDFPKEASVAIDSCSTTLSFEYEAGKIEGKLQLKDKGMIEVGLDEGNFELGVRFTMVPIWDSLKAFQRLDKVELFGSSNVLRFTQHTIEFRRLNGKKAVFKQALVDLFRKAILGPIERLLANRALPNLEAKLNRKLRASMAVLTETVNSFLDTYTITGYLPDWVWEHTIGYKPEFKLPEVAVRINSKVGEVRLVVSEDTIRRHKGLRCEFLHSKIDGIAMPQVSPPYVRLCMPRQDLGGDGFESIETEEAATKYCEGGWRRSNSATFDVSSVPMGIAFRCEIGRKKKPAGEGIIQVMRTLEPGQMHDIREKVRMRKYDFQVGFFPSE